MPLSRPRSDHDGSKRPLPVRRAARVEGFTLVEFLVVLLVLGILAAILIPAIQATRSQALGTAAASTLRTTGQAILLYASDHGGKLPGPTYTAQAVTRTEGGQRFLVDHLASYFGAEDFLDGQIVKGMANDAILDATGEDPSYYHYFTVHRQRAENGDWLPPDSDPWGYPGLGEPKPLVAVKRPAEQIALKEMDQQVRGPPGFQQGFSYPENAIPEPVQGDYRHVLFFDGHVDTEPAVPPPNR